MHGSLKSNDTRICSPVNFVSIWSGLKQNYLLSLCFKAMYVTTAEAGIPRVFVSTRFAPDPPHGMLWLDNKVYFEKGCVAGKKMDSEKKLESVSQSLSSVLYKGVWNLWCLPKNAICPGFRSSCLRRAQSTGELEYKVPLVTRMTFVILSMARREN